jgi:hypothetical protein
MIESVGRRRVENLSPRILAVEKEWAMGIKQMKAIATERRGK